MDPVFISYVRRASAAQAKALHQTLEVDSFLDQSDVVLGERFPEVLADALLNSRVVVVFADEAYFRRWYCLWELRTALGPAAFAGETLARLDALSLDHVVIVLPDGETRPAEVDRLPPALKSGNWPRASETQRIAELVKARLATTPTPVSQLYADAGQNVEAVKARLLDLAANPPPLSLAGKRTFPTTIPPPLKTFVGRSHDLWRVDFALSTLSGGAAEAAPMGSIEGSGGFGKSTLAREYLHRFGPKRFPGGLFWINAEEPLDAQFHGVLQTLRTVPDLPEFQRQHRGARKELEAALHDEAAKAPILWVVDNIPEDGQPLREYCPALGKVAVLTTSRRKLSVFEDSMCALPLGVLDAASAVDLLSGGLSPTPPRRDSEAVVEWVGRMPVALVVLNASLRLRRFTLAELITTAKKYGELAKQLDQELKAVAKRGSKGLPGGVTQAFGLSYERLSPEAQEGARLIARLAPAAIPFELVQALRLSADVRGELIETSFVGDSDSDLREAQSARPAFGAMHRVVAAYLRSRATDPSAEVVRAVEAVTSTLESARKALDLWRVLLDCAPHAHSLLKVTQPTGGKYQIPTQVRADLAFELSNAAGELGRREEALATAQEAVEAFRPLAEAEPETFEPKLARALKSLSIRLGDLGRRQEALPPILEAVEIGRRLAKANPDAIEPDLASFLNVLSNKLSELERREEALAPIKEAVEIGRCLARVEPAAYEPDLTKSLTSLSNRLVGLGRPSEALPPIKEAVEIARRLVKTRPDAFEPVLAGSLNSLSYHLSELGRREESLAAIEEAISVYRRLVKTRPDAFESLLAVSLKHLANRLSELGRRDEALAPVKEAVEIFRRLAKATPHAFDPNLAGSLNDLAARVSDLGRWEEALAPIEETVEVFRRLAKATPRAFEPDLAVSVNNLSECFTNLGRWGEALPVIEEAVERFRQLAKTIPDAFERHLAYSLNNLCICLGDLGRWGEALPAIESSVEIRRRLAKERPTVFEPDLAKSLKSLSDCLGALGRREEADDAAREAAEIRARLDQKRA